MATAGMSPSCRRARLHWTRSRFVRFLPAGLGMPGGLREAKARARLAKVIVPAVAFWHQHGLLDSPQKRPAGKGHGSVPTLYPASHSVPCCAPWATLTHYAKDATRASKVRSRTVAREVLSQMDNPQATPRDRRELLDALTETAYTGQPDFERLEHAVSAVFDAGTTQIRRAVGHPSAPVTTEALVTGVRARVMAIERSPPVR